MEKGDTEKPVLGKKFGWTGEQQNEWDVGMEEGGKGGLSTGGQGQSGGALCPLIKEAVPSLQKIRRLLQTD